MSVHLSPGQIEASSFDIIDAEAGPHSWAPEEWQVVRRVIHTSADFDYLRTMVIGAGAVRAGIAALSAGAVLTTDTTMALSGINKRLLAACGGTAACFVADQEVAREAAARGVTRSLIAMRKGVAVAGAGIFVIGNAPTALFELIRLIRDEGARPALIVGLPVGFVGAAESKEALRKLAGEYPGIPVITNIGRKGGSNVAAAVVNALLLQTTVCKMTAGGSHR